jgi:LmbE family N-acetylglucosaminyl deacetylase
MVEKNTDHRLLAVLAHPDDESFGMGGTLALYAQRGVEAYLVCATRGEVGDVDADCLEGFESVAERREYELRCAAKKLGLKGVFFLGYHDSGMEGSPFNLLPEALFAAPLEEVTEKVVHYIRLLKPQVVVTFDPIGGYRHPDHIAIHKATVAAFQAASDPEQFPGDQPPYQPQKLYFQTIPKRWLKLIVRVMKLVGQDPHKFGRNKDIDLASLAAVDFPVHAVVNYRPVLQQKKEASICHDSQGGGNMQRGAFGWAMRLFGAKESYMRAFPIPKNGKKERDLFYGVSSTSE